MKFTPLEVQRSSFNQRQSIIHSLISAYNILMLFYANVNLNFTALYTVYSCLHD